MTITSETWPSVPEVAEALGAAQRDVKNTPAGRRILTVRRGEAVALAIPPLTLVDGSGKAAVLPPLRGTLTALSGAGCSDEEAWRWLIAMNGGLGERPIDALRVGHVHAVRRAAMTFMF